MKTDLRPSLLPGNIVQTKAGILLFVLENMASGITYDRLDGTEVAGFVEWGEVEWVELTAEWLGTMGFRHFLDQISIDIIVEYEDYRNDRMCVIPIKNGKWEIEYSPFSNLNERIHIATIEYLNQLQNLYQALCGEELKVNLQQWKK